MAALRQPHPDAPGILPGPGDPVRVSLLVQRRKEGNKMIQYLYQEGVPACSKEPLKVRLDGRVCGEIRKVTGGFQYFPAGQKAGGVIYPTVDDVQRSIDHG
jgi:hypothetical protein